MNGLVALTGATGFIGKRLTAYLQERRYQVRTLARSPARSAELDASGVDIVQGDLHDSTALERLVRDCDAVIHLAGAVRGNNLDQFMHTNRDGTARLLEAIAAEAPDSRFLLVSSLAAREPQLSWYAQSKRAAEELVQASALDWVIMRPPAVYGPGDREMKALFDWMSRGVALVPGSPDARTALVYVDDLIRAIVACAASPGATHKILHLCDGKTGGYDWHEIAAIAAGVYGRPVRLWHPPAALLNTVATTNLCIARVTGRAAMLTPLKLNELRHDNWVVDNLDMTETTGWTPQTGLHEGLQKLTEAAL